MTFDFLRKDFRERGVPHASPLAAPPGAKDKFGRLDLRALSPWAAGRTALAAGYTSANYNSAGSFLALKVWPKCQVRFGHILAVLRSNRRRCRSFCGHGTSLLPRD